MEVGILILIRVYVNYRQIKVDLHARGANNYFIKKTLTIKYFSNLIIENIDYLKVVFYKYKKMIDLRLYNLLYLSKRNYLFK